MLRCTMVPKGRMVAYVVGVVPEVVAVYITVVQPHAHVVRVVYAFTGPWLQRITPVIAVTLCRPIGLSTGF